MKSCSITLILRIFLLLSMMIRGEDGTMFVMASFLRLVLNIKLISSQLIGRNEKKRFRNFLQRLSQSLWSQSLI